MALPGPKRYEHFIKRVADCEEVWGLYQNGWALAATNEEGQSCLPVWPAKEYAAVCANKEWQEYQPKSISLTEFIDEFIPDLKNTNISICVFYLPSDRGVIPTFEQLNDDLKNELSRYE